MRCTLDQCHMQSNLHDIFCIILLLRPKSGLLGIRMNHSFTCKIGQLGPKYSHFHRSCRCHHLNRNHSLSRNFYSEFHPSIVYHYTCLHRESHHLMYFGLIRSQYHTYYKLWHHHILSSVHCISSRYYRQEQTCQGTL